MCVQGKPQSFLCRVCFKANFDHMNLKPPMFTYVTCWTHSFMSTSSHVVFSYVEQTSWETHSEMKGLYLKEIGCGNVNWFRMGQNKIQ
jgi:hypothetical protein